MNEIGRVLTQVVLSPAAVLPADSSSINLPLATSRCISFLNFFSLLNQVTRAMVTDTTALMLMTETK